MKKERIRLLNKEKEVKGPIIYWMSRDQRVDDNWALIFAQKMAIQKKQPLIVIFCLQHEFLNATLRIYNFMIEGLKKVESKLEALNISFILQIGNPENIISDFVEDNNISTVIPLES